MKNWLKILLILAVIGVVAAILVYVFVYNKPHTDYEKAEPLFSLTANDFYEAYKTSASASDDKYTGQVVELSGELTKVENLDSLVIVVFVFEEGMFGDEGIRCTMLPKYNEVALDMPENRRIRIKGYCTGYNDTDVILEKCSIIE